MDNYALTHVSITFTKFQQEFVNGKSDKNFAVDFHLSRYHLLFRRITVAATGPPEWFLSSKGLNYIKKTFREQ